MPSTLGQPNSLSLAGDGDELELLEQLEDVFDLDLPDAEMRAVCSLGDAFALIEQRLAESGTGGRKCRSAMAFYRLSRALGGTRRASLNSLVTTPLEVSPRAFELQLQAESGLDLPPMTRLKPGLVVVLATIGLGLPAAALVAGFPAWLSLFGLPLAIAAFLWSAMPFLRMRFSAWTYSGTLADLCQVAAERNYERLVEQGARWNRSEAWDVFCRVVAPFGDIPAQDLRPDTTFLNRAT